MTKINSSPPISWPKLALFAVGCGIGVNVIRGCANEDKTNITPQTEESRNEVPDKNGVFLSTVDQVLDKAKLGKITNAYLWVNGGKAQNTPYYEFILKNGNRNYLLVPSDSKEIQKLEQGLRTLSPEPIIITKGDKSTIEKVIDTGSGFISILLPVAILLLLLPVLKSVMGAHKNWEIVKESGKKFSDVRGYPKIVERLEKIVKYIKDTEKNKVGAVLPKGVLLCGPPGTGKTLMAKAVAGEAKTPMIITNGSDFMNTPLAGVATKKVDGLFNQAEEIAKKEGGCIIFVDELDALGSIRGNSGTDVGHEHSKTLNKFLERMDGFKPTTNVMVIAATNRVEVIDPALTRPGRFDLIIEIPPPISSKQREDILDKYLGEKRDNGQLAEDVNSKSLAENTEGFTGAQLEGLVKQAALIAFEKGQSQINMDNFYKAICEIGVGMEHGELVKEVDRWVTGVHEVGGHEILGIACGKEIEAVSMVPRGRSLGHVRFSRGKDNGIIQSKVDLLQDILFALGGRAAEKTLLPPEKYTLGAMDDLNKVRKMIRMMLTSAMFEGHNSSEYSDNEKELSKEDAQLMNKLIDRALVTSCKIIEQVPKDKLESLIKASLDACELNKEEAKVLYEKHLQGVDWKPIYNLVQEFVNSPLNDLPPKDKDSINLQFKVGA